MPVRRSLPLFLLAAALGVAALQPLLSAQTPTLPPNSVVNNASFRKATEPGGAVAPGAIVAIFGTALASDVQQSMSVPLSTTLGDTSVSFAVGGNTYAAPLFFVSGGQINAQVPFEVPAGASVTAQVKRSGGSSQAQPISVAAASPGVFTLNTQGTGQGAILHANTPTLADSKAPAKPGEFLSIFCTGLGNVQTAVPTGGAATGANPTVNSVLVNIGGLPAEVLYAGLSPGFVGLYQVDVKVPAAAVGNDVPVQIIVNGSISSNTATIAVGR